MTDAIGWLLDSSSFTPRAFCGPGWTDGLRWVHAGSDILIGLAYIAIPAALLFFVRRRGVPFTGLIWLFGAFILACGTGHLIEATMFNTPVYRLSGAVKVLTAGVSWLTVVALIPAAPRVIRAVETLSGRPELREPPPESSDGAAALRTRRYAVAVLAAVLAVLVRAALDPLLQGTHIFFIPLLAVVSVAWYGGLWPALVTLSLSMVAVVYLFVEPRNSLVVADLGDQLGTGLYVFAGVACALLGEAQRQHRVGAEQAFQAVLLKQAELQAEVARREESENRYRTLSEAVPQIVWNAGADGEMNYFNARWREYTGLLIEAARGSGWIQAVHPDDAGRVAAAWRAAATRPDEFSQELRLRGDTDGQYRWFQAVAVPLRKPDGTVDQWIGSMADVHDRKERAAVLERMVAERTAALTATAAELGRSNEELEKFAYVASHDLQEPLRKIQAFGDRLGGRFAETLGDQGRDYLTRMLNSAGRMRQLINDLLAFSRVTTKTQPFAPVDLNRVAADAVDDLSDRIQQTGGRVEVGPLPTIDADPTQMRQLLQNLIANALKFHMPDVPPVVTVRAEEAQTDAHVGPPRPAVRIEVADNGIGFEEKYLDRIFQVFQRLHGRAEYEGTGVGLAICRKIVERHGGEITARSAPGEGATFAATLPLIQPTRTAL